MVDTTRAAAPLTLIGPLAGPLTGSPTAPARGAAIPAPGPIPLDLSATSRPIVTAAQLALPAVRLPYIADDPSAGPARSRYARHHLVSGRPSRRPLSPARRQLV